MHSHHLNSCSFSYFYFFGVDVLSRIDVYTHTHESHVCLQLRWCSRSCLFLCLIGTCTRFIFWIFMSTLMFIFILVHVSIFICISDLCFYFACVHIYIHVCRCMFACVSALHIFIFVCLCLCVHFHMFVFLNMFRCKYLYSELYSYPYLYLLVPVSKYIFISIYI